MMPNEYPQAPWMQDAGFMGQLLRELQKAPRAGQSAAPWGPPMGGGNMDLATLAQSLQTGGDPNYQRAQLARQQRMQESNIQQALLSAQNLGQSSKYIDDAATKYYQQRGPTLAEQAAPSRQQQLIWDSFDRQKNQPDASGWTPGVSTHNYEEMNRRYRENIPLTAPISGHRVAAGMSTHPWRK